MMFRHIFKLIWNRKRKTSLLIVEILISFLVLFFVLTQFSDSVIKSLKPLNFNYKNLLNVTFDYPPSKDTIALTNMYSKILESVKSFPGVEYAALCNLTPYGGSTSNTTFIGLNNNKVQVHRFVASDDMDKVLQLQLIEGRWYDNSDDASSLIPIVMSETFAEKMFGKGVQVTGKKIERKYPNGETLNAIVTGVVKDYRYHGEFEKELCNIFFRDKNMEAAYKGTTLWNNMIVRYRPGNEQEFEEKLQRYLQNLSGWKINLANVEELREKEIKSNTLTILIPGLIALFLILNVALGLLGVLWYSINRRHSEIGLRRAIGASAAKILMQILGESMILGTFSILLGTIVAIQFPILKILKVGLEAYLTGIFFSVVFLYILIAVCALYPGFLASKIEPAEALHNE